MLVTIATLMTAPPNAEAQDALSKTDVATVSDQLWQAYLSKLRDDRSEEAEAKEVRLPDGKTVMRYETLTYGDAPADGRSLYISMHGGGGAPAQVNDRQWKNQIGLYKPAEGVYLAPRAPGNTWDLWHKAPLDDLLIRLIQTMVATAEVDPNKVYLMGYSAGGDGVYQIAPRLADRFAAASMMAGHPNEASPVGLRNLPFAIHVGALDKGYKRNEVAKTWAGRLEELQAADPEGYIHFCKIHAGKGHWMDRDDAEALPWMAKFTRNSRPSRVVWHQDDVTHRSQYWLAIPEGEEPTKGDQIAATIEAQTIKIKSGDQSPNKIAIRLDDTLIDLDQPVVVTWNGTEVYRDKLTRSRATLTSTLRETGDRHLMFPAEIVVEKPAEK